MWRNDSGRWSILSVTLLCSCGAPKKDPLRRLPVVEPLPDTSVDELIASVRANDASATSSAIELVSRGGNAIDTLSENFESLQGLNRQRFYRALLERGPDSVRRAKRILLEHGVRERASHTSPVVWLCLRLIHGEVHDEFVASLSSENPRRAFHAAVVLIETGHPIPPSAPPIAAMLDDEDTRARRNAIRAIRKLGPVARAVAPKLIELLDDPAWNDSSDINDYKAWQDTRDHVLRAEIPGTLLALAPDDPDVISALIRAVGDTDPCFAAHILGCFGDRGRPAIPDLVRLLREARTSYLRTPSAASLGWLVRDDEDAILTLTEALEDSSKTVRKTASDALASIRSTEEEI